MSKIAGRKARVRVSGSALTLTNAATTASADRKRYTITDATKQVLSREDAVTVERSTDSGTTWTTVSSGYTLDRLAGAVIFSVAEAAGTMIRVSGKYLPMATVAFANSASYSLAANTADVSDFDKNAVQRLVTNLDLTGSLGRWSDTDRSLLTKLQAGVPIVLEFFSDKDATKPDCRCWAILTGDEIAAAVQDAQSESIEFETTPDIDGRSYTFL